jgi:hypothetical protein
MTLALTTSLEYPIVSILKHESGYRRFSDIVIVLESPMNLPSGASHERSEIWE